jgi:hypothetical protein
MERLTADTGVAGGAAPATVEIEYCCAIPAVQDASRTNPLR